MIKLRLISYKNFSNEEIDIVIDSILPAIDTDSNESNLQLRIRSEVTKLRPRVANLVVTEDACEGIIDAMVERKLISCYDKIWYRLTSFGTEVLAVGGWLKHLKNVNEERRLDRQIKELTVKQLKGNIFQMKYWYWFLLAASVGGAVISKVSDYLYGKWFTP